MPLSLSDLTRMDNPKHIFIPCCGMAFLTVGILVRLSGARVSSTGPKHQKGKINPKYWQTHDPQLLPPGGESDLSVKLAHNFDNLCETPQLFYAACAALYLLNAVDATAVGLGYGYLAFRVAHTLVHTGSNHVPTRFATFLGSVVVIGVLWSKVLVAAVA